MIQTVKRNLKAPKIPRHSIALLAGASPLIFALLMLGLTVQNSTTLHGGAGWIRYLIQHQDDIIQSLIVSSVMVGVFSTVLRCKAATFAAGFQPVVIQSMFLLTDSTRHIALNIPLAAITVLPLLNLLLTLKKEIDQLDVPNSDNDN